MTVLAPAVLDVRGPTDGRYEYRLNRPEPFVGATQRYWEVEVDAEDVAMFCGRIDDAVLAANTGCDQDTAVETLRNYGRLLYEALLPRHDHDVATLRAALRELSGPLLISAQQSMLQWELLYDEEQGDFLGLSHDIARRLMTREATPARGVEPQSLRCLVIADPSAAEPGSSLPNAASEARQLQDWLGARGVSCDVLEGPEATHGRTVDQFAREVYHVIHFAGHIARHPHTDKFGLRLADGWLTTAWIRRHLRGSPLVFLNGCSSAASGASLIDGVEAMTDAMLAAGARVVVGSIYPLPDIGARKFAERFYSELLGGAPYGSAMRIAREELSRRDEYRASWAGFVMYGDPTQRLVVARAVERSDAIDLLDELGISADEVEDGALAVLQTAGEHAGSGGMLGTPHLFAALVTGSDTRLRERLAQRGLEPDELYVAFQEEFAIRPAGSGEHAYAAKLSDNARRIIEVAAAAARARPAAVCERDLQQAFVECTAGATQQILAELGVDLDTLLDDPHERRGAAPPAPERRTALELAEAIAINSGVGVVGTPQLWQALLSVRPSPAVEALRRVGLGEDLDDPPVPRVLLRPTTAMAAPVPLTTNVTQIVHRARVAAGASERPQTDDDVFHAFLEHGGGSTGVALLRAGLPLALLTSSLFDGAGLLVTDKFDEPARTVLCEAVDCARRKRNDALSRSHLLYGLLLVANGSLQAAIRGQEHDPGSLADRLFIALPTMSSPYPHQTLLRVRRMSGGLIAALCEADRRRRGDQHELIGERHLAGGLLGDGGGSAGAFLNKHGVGLRELPG